MNDKTGKIDEGMQRSPSIKARAGEASPIELEKLIATSQMVSGNFAALDPALTGRVARLVDWLNDQPPLSSERKAGVELQLRKLLANRLRLAADRKKIPGISEEKIERPIFVIGFARTGTTLLHSLLAEDPEARAPLWWHTHDPSPPPGQVPVVAERIEFTGKELDELILRTPGFLALHPYWDKRGMCPIEDEEIFTLDFQNAYPTLIWKVPALALLLDAADPAEAYGFQKQFLQHLQWNQPKGHWVVKGIYHQFVLDALFEAYPDALCIWPHRDPLDVWPSTLAITAVLYGAITDWAMDFKELGPAFISSVGASLSQAIQNPLIDDPRIVHVDFRELAKDPVATIKTAYAHWGKTFSPEFEQRMRAWLADPANRPDRYGRYDYGLEPFGLDREMLEEAFAPYRERYGFTSGGKATS